MKAILSLEQRNDSTKTINMSTPSKRVPSMLLFILIPLYLLFIIFQSLSIHEDYRELFPNTTWEVYEKYMLEVTPVTATFSIWAICYIYTILLIIYALSTLVRGGHQTEVLSGKFFFFFIVNISFMIAYVFTWAQSKVITSFIMIMIAQLAIDVCFYFLNTDIHNYILTYEITAENKKDVCFLHYLVQNCITFYGGWTTILTLITTGVVFSYELGASTETASIIVLSFFTVILLAWYLLESFVLQTYTDYTFTHYIAYIWALSGMFVRSWNKNDTVGGFVLGLLILAIVLLVVRIILIAVRCSKRKNYQNIGYDAEKQAIST